MAGPETEADRERLSEQTAKEVAEWRRAHPRDIQQDGEVPSFPEAAVQRGRDRANPRNGQK